jgi:mannose-1-phosphate guanylyltransferase
LVKALLLGAGRGTRLAPLTDKVPKILVPLRGEPLLAHQLRYLERNGVTDVALNVHHHADQVLDFLSSFSTSLAVRVSREPNLLGTAGALIPLKDFLDEPFLLLYGDVVIDENLCHLMDRHHGHIGATASITYYRAPDGAGKGVCQFAEDGRLTSFVEKPVLAEGPANVSAGLYVLDPSVAQLVDDVPFDFGHDLWPRFLQVGKKAYGYELRGYVKDIGSFDALEEANQDLAAGAIRW